MKTTFGLVIVVIAGFCFALFSPAFNLATNDQWHRLKPGVPHLVVYTAFFYFSVMAFIFGVTANLVLLYHPLLGLPKSSLKMYLNDWEGRQWALFAGLLCGLGNGFQFMGGQAAGYAAADAVQVGVSAPPPLIVAFLILLHICKFERKFQNGATNSQNLVWDLVAASKHN